ncbi:Hypothetical protein NGAL_HAMBI1146_58870 [Neorhizobium galegae bv. officinalis]|nr:Hypothetical protein NGAL_HAMBI1146_58870 [Neorhizobium galegae bv. officinalis]
MCKNKLAHLVNSYSQKLSRRSRPSTWSRWFGKRFPLSFFRLVELLKNAVQLRLCRRLLAVGKNSKAVADPLQLGNDLIRLQSVSKF